MYAGDGNDIVIGGAGADSIYDGNGYAVIIADSGRVEAAAGYDANAAFSAHPLMLGCIETFVSADATNDIVVSGADSALIFGGLGNDLIYAGGGNDLVFGEYGKVCSDIVDADCLPYSFSNRSGEFYGEYGYIRPRTPASSSTVTLTTISNSLRLML